MSSQAQTTTSLTRTKIVEEALSRGYTVNYFGNNDKYYEITTPEGRSAIFTGSSWQASSFIGTEIATHKFSSYQYLQHIGVGLPPFLRYQNSDDHQAQDFLAIHKPIVVKPEDSWQSNGVTVGVSTVEQLNAAIIAAQQHSSTVVLQKQLTGHLYRILAVGGVFCAATDRRAPYVTGDGVQTTAQLLDILNAALRQSADGRPIDYGQVVAYIGEEGLSSIPEIGKEVRLNLDSNARGGEIIDVTEMVHPDYIRITEEIAQRLDLTTCGIDIITNDISQPMEDFLPFLEMNAFPGLRSHYSAKGGKSRNIAALILDAALVNEKPMLNSWKTAQA